MRAFATGVFWLVWFSVPCPIHGKIQKGTVSLGNTALDKPWQYLSKFGYEIGSGDYSLRARIRNHDVLENTGHVDFDLFLDEDWGKVESLAPCQRAVHGPSRRTLNIDLPATGEWGWWWRGSVIQVVRPHIWYFALSSCNQLHMQNITFIIDYELHLQQADGSEFSLEIRYMLPANVAALLAFSAFAIGYVFRCRAFCKSTGTAHLVIWILTGSMALQYAGQVLHMAHLCKYCQNGEGLQHLDLLSEVLLMMSQVIQSTLLIVIALGYTILYSTMDKLEIVKPVSLAMSVVHAILVGFSKVQKESSWKHHERDDMIGWLILAIRLLLYAWFLVATQSSQQKGSFQLQSFLHQFQMTGSIYFLAYPVILTIVQACAPYLQHPIMQTGLLAMQTACNGWLASLFLSRGAYFKISVLSLPLLPGCTGPKYNMDSS